ncbi:class IV adenylate cyclase, partial [Candidatus Pacearchaeota archaeon]|nr:class IV adenylate cyclase [Candidatus Pacearchaeota archaeon]
MIEVEAKIKISSPSEIRKDIKKFAVFAAIQNKHDDYYTLEHGHYPQKSLRVRKMKDRYIINFKQRVSYKDGVHAKKEVEFVVHDIEGFLELISDFGFKKWLHKEKRTELYHISKNFHVELNHLEGLGWFVEVEYLTKDNVAYARKEVLKIVNKLGFSSKDLVKEGYTKLMW